MIHYRLTFVCLIAMSMTFVGFSQTGNGWRPNTRLLDIAAKADVSPTDDAKRALAHDVKTFYELLREKQWRKTYELRAKVFREDTPEDEYVSEGLQVEKSWGLANYEVLSLEFDKTPGSKSVDQAVLICKFTTLPDSAVNYSTVYWHREDGVWKCLSAGPSGPSIFYGTRPPYIDWQ